MANFTWPASLPDRLEIDGYSQTLPNNLITTNFDVGSPQVRRRSTSAPEKITGTFVMSLDELIVFKAFYNTTLLSGTQRFDWYDPATRVPVEMLFDPTTVPNYSNIGGDVYSVSVSFLMFNSTGGVPL